jgi:hypothetical protein
VSPRAVLAAVVLTACICSCDAAPPEAAPPDARLSGSDLAGEQIGGCIQAHEAKLEVYDDGEVSAAVALMGEGRAGVVVSYEENGSVCNWLAAAKRLTEAGYTVLLYDRLRGREGAFVPAMTRLIRQRGVQEVALLGGAVGGAVSISEAAFLQPPPSAVVSLAGADTGTALVAGKLPSPLLQVVARKDPALQAAVDTHGAAGPRGHRLLVLPGNAHASMLFPVHAQALRAIERFLRRVMPP